MDCYWLLTVLHLWPDILLGVVGPIFGRYFCHRKGYATLADIEEIVRTFKISLKQIKDLGVTG